MSEPLPGGWATFALRDCVDVLDGRRIPVNSEERAHRPGDVPYYGATGQVGWIDDFLFDEELLLIGEDGAPFLDKSKPIAYIIQGKSWVNNHAHVLRAKAGVTSNRYLEHYLDSFDFGDYVNGTTRLKLTQGSMNQIPVRLAPLGEQRRIVAKLEDLLSKVVGCRKRLAKIPVLLKRFRQSVLAAACSGRLTADWRDKYPTEECVEDRIEAILRSRETDARTPAQRQRLREIFDVPEEGDGAELPENWAFIALRKLSASFEYGTSAKSHPSGKIPVLRMGNIQNGKINWEDLVFTSDREEIAKYSLRPSTVLFNRTNSPELVGKTAIYRGERPAIFAGYLIRVNPLPVLDPEYLNLCLNTSYAREYCHRVKTDGVSQSNINAKKLAAFEVPLPPLPEQHEIVRRVEALFALADQIEARYAKAKPHVDRLTLSILARAFRGELVPQDPSDEPASALLERIRAETATKERGIATKRRSRRHPGEVATSFRG